MGEPAIRVTGLSKRFRLHHASGGDRTFREDLAGLPRRAWNRLRGARDEEFWALRDVSFEVGAGEVIGVIGRNGAGKSTLLKILSRITAPTAGEVELYGRVGSLLEVGTGFHPELTGRENIFLSGAILGMSRPDIRRRFDEIVAFAGVEQFLDTPCKHYSSGMYLRLGFAVAAHLDADILLVDEVLAVGDAEFQRKCLAKMGEVAGGGRTVVLVSHNLEAVQRICGTAIRLDRGSIETRGPADEVVGSYLREVARTMPDFDLSKLAIGRSTAGVTIRSVRVSGKDAGLVRTGEAMYVDIDYVTGPVYSRWDAGLVFSLMLPDGQEILRLSTEPISGYHLCCLGATGTVRLVLEALPLAAGVFLVGIGLTRPNVEFVLDPVPVGRITVHGSDIYGSGHIPKMDRGVMVVAHHWEHRAGAAPDPGPLS